MAQADKTKVFLSMAAPATPAVPGKSPCFSLLHKLNSPNAYVFGCAYNKRAYVCEYRHNKRASVW